MTWEHRVCKEKCEQTKEIVYTIREVFYNKDGEIWGVTDTPGGIGPYATTEIDDPEEEGLRKIRKDIWRITQATLKSVIDLDTIKFASPDFTIPNQGEDNG